MNADRDTTRVVRSWLRTDDHESADRVLEIVLSSLDTTPQRRHLWPARRLTRMINGTRLAIGAAAAVLVVGFLGYNLASLTPDVGMAPSPSLAPPSTPSQTPAASIPSLAGQESLGGRYRIPSIGTSGATVAVPAGWSAGGDWVVVGPNGNEAPAGMAVRFYTVRNVIVNPVNLAEGFMTPAVGGTVEDLVQAIVAHPDWIASAPSDITLDGYAGRKVSITIPPDASMGSDGNFYLFSAEPDGEVWGWAPGQVFDLLVVDVDGTRVVIDAFHHPDTSAAHLAAQQAVLDSIEFAPNP
jgi:hypothetical protein